ncbi:metal ABC transporter permease [Thermococcus gammatolerans]|uniref:Manganese ABC-type transporter, permease component (MntC) n=1 Tax=Thermococcus gammatolerans (strain DSM 15229 / JCM 11827 / EJ3) TaxID=593117 RepID=C5A5T0_THEGJ|nr:metal ABC transporter permease [Thermococcus gammatolerans]ACS33592.1 Manganese ABC-type transporter, permease component (mntC) [Thermococcus gammatolerans EJ3]
MIPEFMLRAILASITISVLLGLLSPLINMKGLAFLTHALFHALLFGAVLGMILGLVFNNLSLVMAVATLITVLIVLTIAELERLGFSSDSAVGIVASFVAGLTVLGFGVLYKLMAGRPYFPLTENVVSYLTGELFLITRENLLTLTGLGFAILLVLLLFYRDFLYISFDMEGVESYGGRARFYLVLLYVLVGLVGSLIVQSVGLVTLQVVAVLPGAIGLMVSDNLKKVVLTSLLVTLTVQLSSVIIAYFTSIPPSGIATIILGIVYGILLVRK